MLKGFFDRFRKKGQVDQGKEDVEELKDQAQEEVHHMKEGLAQGQEELGQALDQVREEVQEIQEELEQDLAPQGEGLKDQLDQAKEGLEEGLEELSQAGQPIQEALEQLADQELGLEEKLEAGLKDLKAEVQEVQEATQELAVGMEEGGQEPGPEDQEGLAAAPAEEKKGGIFNRFLKGLTKTRNQLSRQIDVVLADFRTLDAQMMEDLENVLIAADLGVETTMKVVDTLDQNLRVKNIKEASRAKEELAQILKDMIHEQGLNHDFSFASPTVLLVVGVNGVGKTTSIGKMAHRLKEEGKSVTLVAADTFRAAAIEQLEEWARRADVPLIAHQEGADPASVVYDGLASARSKQTDILICDTAGRLHNKKNLMAELEKINRIIDREYPEAKKEVYIVVDGTTGQNALHQAREFKKATDVTGAIITKLDGTAKGGILIPLEVEEKIPVKLIGIGEQIDDLVDFQVDEFIDAIVN